MKKLTVLLALALILGTMVIAAGSTSDGGSHSVGPVAYWSFDDGTADDLAHDNDGTLEGDTVASTDVPPTPSNGLSLSFDGDGDHVPVANEANFDFERTDPFTLSVWFKTSSDDLMNVLTKMDNERPNRGYQLIKHRSTGDAFGVPFDNRLYFFLIHDFDAGDMIRLAAPTDVADGQWHHAAVTYDGSSTADGVRLFLDGAEEPLTVTHDGLTGTILNDLPLQISGREGTNFAFDGLLDEPQVYARALSAEEVALLSGTGDVLVVDKDGMVGLGEDFLVDCDGVGVRAFTSIQEGVDAATDGQRVLVCGETYTETLVIGAANSGMSLEAVPDETPVLDGTVLQGSATSIFGIALQDGVHDVTIQGLTIQNYVGDGGDADRSSAIMAWGVETADITVQDNRLLDNWWNGVLVGSRGDAFHTGWAVHDNVATGNGFVQIELTNCNECSIHGNTVSGGLVGILVQARNTVPDSGEIVMSSVSVKRNQVEGAVFGLLILALASEVDFDPIAGAEAELHDVSVGNNRFVKNFIGSLVWGFSGFGDTGKGQVFDTAFVNNAFQGDPNVGDDIGILLFNDDVINTKLVRNSFEDYATDIEDDGSETKLPLGPPES